MNVDKDNMVLRNLRVAIQYRNTPLFLRYLENHIMESESFEIMAANLDMDSSTLFRKLRENDLSWDEVNSILRESGYILSIKESK